MIKYVCYQSLITMGTKNSYFNHSYVNNFNGNKPEILKTVNLKSWLKID